MLHCRRYFCLLLLQTLVVFTALGQIPGPSVNMVSGTQWPGGDPYLQRQNEPSMAVSSRNGLHLLAGANDYRTVDIPASTPGETGDAWLGVFKSFDGGQTWRSTLIPGYPQDTPQWGRSPFAGLTAAADPVVRAGTNGLFYYSGVAFDRATGKASKIFVTRFIDDNNVEGSDTIRNLGVSTISLGDGSHFLDKPTIAVDIPRADAGTCFIPGTATVPAQSFPAGRVYAAYTQFDGGEDSKIASIMLTQSNDCGITWSRPTKVSKTDQTNQGAAIAINPVTGDVYVVWRIFTSPTGPDGIAAVINPYVPWATSPASGVSDPARIATFTPFDQGTTNVSFRTNAYPSIAMDGSGLVYISWSQRGLGPQGDARAVVTTGRGRATQFDVLNLEMPQFTAPAIIDPNGARGHQIMPALAFSSGKLTATWYDFRDDDTVIHYTPTGGGQYTQTLQVDGIPVFSNFIADPLPLIAGVPPTYASTARRHTVEVRAAQALSGMPPIFKPSVIVSQYAFGTPAGDNSGQVEQLEFDAPNLPMFRQGSVPFFGDYIDIAGPTFIPVGNTWRFNTQASDPDQTHVVWTDNRNVVQPADGNWANYTPVGSTSGTSLFDPTVQRPACTAGQTGMRNQDIYTATLTSGIMMGAKGNRKQLSTTLLREFAVTVQNTTAQTRSYRLSIGAQPPGGVASFLQFTASAVNIVTQLDISIPPLSSAARSVYITSTNPNATVPVTAQEITGPSGTIVSGGLSSSTTLNSDISNPNISNPNISNPNISNPNISNAEVYNPNISNPNISNPNISNPNISNPNISNPNISNVTIANPNISNPNISNPNISNPNISNPNISNPNISNPNISNTALTDTSYTVTNYGNTAAAYTVKLLQNQTIPPGVTVQLLVSGIYTTPVANGCNLTVQANYVPLLNLASPTFVNPSNIVTGGLVDPNAPTFALVPGEQALVTIRFTYPPGTFDPSLAVTPAVASIPANTGTTVPPVTLTITTASLAPATANRAYSQTLQATGGTGAGLNWLPVGSLPAGLTLTPSGVLQGSPSSQGTYPITIKVTDNGQNTTTRIFSLVVNPAPAITTASLSPGEQNVVYSKQLTASGGTPPLVWSATPGTLPTGFSITTGGLLSGSALAGTSSPVVTVTDANGAFAAQTYSLTIAAPLAISTASLPNGSLGVQYTTTLSTSGGVGPFVWALQVPGSTPAGLTLSGAGVISGMPTVQGGPTSFAVKVTDSLNVTVMRTLSITVASTLAITPVTLAQATVNAAITPTQLQATGGTQPYMSWAVDSGAPPTGVTISPTGLISGTPTVGGQFTFVAKVVDNAGATATLSLHLTVGPQITNGPVAGFQGYTYAATLLTATGGTPPYTWTGSLPTGMNLTPSGILTGFPTVAGTGTVTVTDNSGASTSASFSIASSEVSIGAGSPSVVTISNVKLTASEGAGPVQITTTPGATVPVSLNYSLIEGTSYCPHCIDQLLVGFVGTNATTCLYDGQPGPSGTSGPASVNLTAPSMPGRYYITFSRPQQYTCPNALAIPLSSSTPVIGVVDVIPTSVTWGPINLTNISIDPPQVAPGNTVTVGFNFAPPAFHTIGLGFNIDQAPTRCGGLNYSQDTVQLTAPLLPGRYYISIDDMNTCANVTSWDHGVPGSNFARFIGAIDVLNPQ